eukprot:Nk52_evm34s2496 gene=Nk52_evmTU34s2496
MQLGYFDLSHILDEKIPRWPEDPQTRFTNVSCGTSTSNVEGYLFLREISYGEHSGTHMNSPRSFFPFPSMPATDSETIATKIGIEDYPVERLVDIPAVVIDISNQSKARIEAADGIGGVSVEDILNWEKRMGKSCPKGGIVFMYSGWEQHWCEPQKYLNDMKFPGFEAGAVAFLVKERGVVGIGADTMGVDCGKDEKFLANRTILAVPYGISLENVANLSKLLPYNDSEHRISVSIGVPRVRECSGAIVSLYAQVSKV